MVFCPAVSDVEEGITEQLAYAGAPVKARFTVPLKLLEPRTRLYVAVDPAATVAEFPPVAEGARLTGEVAVPLTFIDCDPAVALSLIVSWPLRLPDKVGVNVTVMMQEAPDASAVPQLLVAAKIPCSSDFRNDQRPRCRYSEA